MFKCGHFIHTAAQGPHIWLETKKHPVWSSSYWEIKYSHWEQMNQIPCGYRVYWRRAQGSCSMASLWACWPCHSGSPILVQCQGPRLWWCSSLSRRCSVFWGLCGECSSRAGTEKQSDFKHFVLVYINLTWTSLSLWEYTVPGVPSLSGRTTPPPASQGGAPPSAVWVCDRGHHLHRSPSQCRAGSRLLPTTPCRSQCLDVAAGTEAAPLALQRAAPAWRRWLDSAS